MEDSKQEVGLRYSEGKPGVEYIDFDMLYGLNDVYRFGAKKYAPNNWKKGMNWDLCYNAAFRHVDKWRRGEQVDSESGVHHLWHAIWNLFTLWWYEKHNKGVDNLRKKE